MQKKWLLISGSGLLLVALIAISATVWALPAVRSSTPALLTQAQPQAPRAQTGPQLLTGSYQGAVTLQWTLPGIYSAPLPTPTPGGPPAPDLGAVDLSLWLNSAGTNVSGYVALAETLIFSVEHTITATPVGPTPQPGTPTSAPVTLKIGPQVQGTLNGSQFTLTSERITDLINGKSIERQFRLIGTVSQPSVTQLLLTGEYRETVWGYTLQPVTVIGAFTLAQTLFPTFTPPPITATPSATHTPTPTNSPTHTPTSLPACLPTADQVALFVDINYGGACVVKAIGNYADANAIGLPDNTISSLRVGANVRASLCPDINYLGGCTSFSANDSDLSNNTIGDNRISSVRVIRRATPTPTFTPTPDLIFSDDFESNSLTRWNASTIGGGDLRTSANAKLVGNIGLEAVINDNTVLYVRDNLVTPATEYHARFYFNPNGIGMANNDSHYLFAAYTGATTPVNVLRLELRYTTTGGYRLALLWRRDVGTWVTASYPLTNARHWIEIGWKTASAPGATDGRVNLWLDGASKYRITNATNNLAPIGSVRLGAVAGLDTGTRGVYYFDDFVSRTSSCIGPDIGEQPLASGQCPGGVQSAGVMAEGGVAGEAVVAEDGLVEEGLVEALSEEPVEEVLGDPDPLPVIMEEPTPTPEAPTPTALVAPIETEIEEIAIDETIDPNATSAPPQTSAGPLRFYLPLVQN